MQLYDHQNLFKVLAKANGSLVLYFGTAQSLHRLVATAFLEARLESFIINCPGWICS
jgi:hypothetical protein